MGWDGDRPTRQLDALVHEIDPGTYDNHPSPLVGRDSFHGRGQWMDGSRRRPLRLESVGRDHLPAWSWHRHGNESDKVARFMSYSSEPTLWTLGMSVLEDAGDESFARLSPRPPVSPGNSRATIRMHADCVASTLKQRSALGAHPHALRRAGDPRDAARHPHEVPQRPRDWQPGIRADAGDDSVRPWQDTVAAPPPGEAWLYVVEGYGHSFMGHRARTTVSIIDGRRAT
jgi:gentisate 1,2-dioxygenase